MFDKGFGTYYLKYDKMSTGMFFSITTTGSARDIL